MLPLFGVGVALLVAEGLLRVVATGATLDGIPVGETYRQYSEGIATSHFLDDSSRSTGNAWLPGAPIVLILGDSHVTAVQIEDSQTMGSVLERIARAQGLPLNVRQFGWSGAGYGVARTLALGPQLAARFDPERVVVVLSEGAMRTYPVDAAAAEQLRSEEPPSIRNLGRLQRFARHLGHYSVLAHLSYVRAREVWNRRDAEPPALAVARGCVHGPSDARLVVIDDLKREFGAKLLVVYAPDIGLDTTDAPDCWESLLLPQCADRAVECVSLRSEMLAARRRGVLVRGFSNTQLGAGHLNEAGHEMIARLVLDRLPPRDASR